MRSEQTRGPTGVGRRALLAAVVAWALAAGTGGRPSPTAQDARMDGEYGLYVGLAGDSLDVRWVTARTGDGFARILRGGVTVDSSASPEGRGHEVRLLRPDGPAATLEYGSLSDEADRHATRLDLRPPRADPDPRYPAPDSLYVLGDVHGEFGHLTAVLRNAGLVGPDLSWAGSTATLVLVGDLVDRGPDATRVLWYVYRLEREAAAAGGRVLVMLGNHEIMVMTNDLRYTAEKERLVARLEGLPYWRLLDLRTSLLGRWLASRPALARVGDVLLAHGGVSDAYADWSPGRFQDSLSRYLHGEVLRIWADSTYRPDPSRVRELGLDSAAVVRRYEFFFGDRSVFWYRGYVDSDTLSDELARVLGRQHASVHVVGHSTVPTIRQSYGDSLVAVDMEDPATEMLLMVREPGAGPGDAHGWRRYRIGMQGPPEELPTARR